MRLVLIAVLALSAGAAVALPITIDSPATFCVATDLTPCTFECVPPSAHLVGVNGRASIQCPGHEESWCSGTLCWSTYVPAQAGRGSCRHESSSLPGFTVCG
jgi:hypothetical protein